MPSPCKPAGWAAVAAAAAGARAPLLPTYKGAPVAPAHLHLHALLMIPAAPHRSAAHGGAKGVVSRGPGAAAGTADRKGSCMAVVAGQAGSSKDGGH
jgi:hypothetical protein